MYGWFLVVVTVLANAEVSGVTLGKYYIYDECDHAAHMNLGRLERGQTLVCIEDVTPSEKEDLE